MPSKTELFGRWLQGSVVIADEGVSTGRRFWVHSGTGTDGAGHGGSPDAPFASIDYAIGKCTADKGDIIYVMPGHAESYGDGEGFTADIAAVRIIGIGWGAARPTLTFAHAAASCAVSAASVAIENIRFVAGITAVAAGVALAATATDFEMRGCEFYWGGTTGDDFVLCVSMLAGADRAIFEGNRFLQEPAVAGNASAIKFVGPCDNMIIRGNEFMGDSSVACVNGITAISQGLMFLDNVVHNADAGEPYLEVFTGTTGVIANTRGLASGATIAANAVADAMAHCENFVVNTAGTYAIIGGAGGVPAVDAD